jgi:hypothetical protein
MIRRELQSHRHAVGQRALWVAMAAFSFMSAAVVADNRGDITSKGSFLVFPNVEIKWTKDGELIQDTFLGVSNEFPDDVEVQFYFLNGDEPLEEVFIGFPIMRAAESEPGWNWINCRRHLTANQPTVWSAAKGSAEGCQAFGGLDPPAGYQLPGRPDPETNGETRVLRGAVFAWAVGYVGEPAHWQEIKWNHLFGEALIVNYAEGTAWEYNAYAFTALTPEPQGSPTDDTPGVLVTDGKEYDSTPERLLLDFYAPGTEAFSLGALGAPGSVQVSIDTDLTLLPMKLDFRQDHEGPTVTKIEFEIFNENEVKLSGARRCLICWGQRLLSFYFDGQFNIPNYFLLERLGTDKGMARIDGVHSIECDDIESPFLPEYHESVDSPLLGVAAKVISFDAGADMDVAGITLVGLGEETGYLRHDVSVSDSDEQGTPEQDEAGADARAQRSSPRTKFPTRAMERTGAVPVPMVPR